MSCLMSCLMSCQLVIWVAGGCPRPRCRAGLVEMLSSLRNPDERSMSPREIRAPATANVDGLPACEYGKCLEM